MITAQNFSIIGRDMIIYNDRVIQDNHGQGQLQPLIPVTPGIAQNESEKTGTITASPVQRNVKVGHNGLPLLPNGIIPLSKKNIHIEK